VVATVARLEYGIHLYADATNILILCDAGGANSYRHHIFKDRLLKLANELGMSFSICHYPPYASKRFAVAMESY
jgi:Rhodopirellula transposase DDE domain